MLEIAINEFWVQQIQKPYYKTIPYWKDHNTNNYYQYCVFHKSEEGTSINLDDSAHATRMVSIHSSKGDGREVVFVIGITESGLKVYSGLTDTLKYNSL
jgi:ATP-dependent exoDNAse (exonuclease V) beta subunit